MPSRLPNVPFAPSYDQRQSTFGTIVNLNPTEKLFALWGFVKTGETVECANCGKCAYVDLYAIWNPRDIAKLHHDSCTFQPTDLEYIISKAIFIRTRNSKGMEILSMGVVQRILEMGFSKEMVIQAVEQFFYDYGRYPEIEDLVDCLVKP